MSVSSFLSEKTKYSTFDARSDKSNHWQRNLLILNLVQKSKSAYNYSHSILRWDNNNRGWKKAEHLESNSRVQFHPAVALLSTCHSCLTPFPWLNSLRKPPVLNLDCPLWLRDTHRHNYAVESHLKGLTTHLQGPYPAILWNFPDPFTLSLSIMPTLFMPSLLISLPKLLAAALLSARLLLPHLPNLPASVPIHKGQPSRYALDPPLSPAQNTTPANVSHSWMVTVSLHYVTIPPNTLHLPS